MFKKLLNQKKQIKAGVLTVIGFILSPLSWWNDFFINIPIAYLFAWLLAKINSNIFLPTLITVYWLTNIIGLLLMHYGIEKIIEKEKRLTKNAIVKHLAFSLIYTLAILVAIQVGWLKFPGIN